MAAHPVSPLAPKTYPDLPAIAGVRFATAEAGIKYKNRTDVLLVAFDAGTIVAGVLTKSKCPSAAVDWCRPTCPAARRGRCWSIRAMPMPSPARRARESVELTADYRRQGAGLRAGRDLPRLHRRHRRAARRREVRRRARPRWRPASADGPWMDAAKAIMTTDTFPKLAARPSSSTASGARSPASPRARA